jgi:hypothetical protein
MLRIDRNLALGAMTLALSAASYRLAARIPESQLADAIGPRGLPKAYAFLLGALSLILIAQSLTHRPAATGASAAAPPPTPQPHPQRRAAGMLAIGIVYIVMVPWVGYLPALAGLIFASTFCQGGAVNRQAAVVAVGGAVFCWVLFVLLMGIPQPPGLWQEVIALTQ